MKYLLFLFVIFAIGCRPIVRAPVELDTDSFIHRDGLRELWPDVVASDEFYMCPKRETVAWIHAGYARRQRATGLFRWIRKWDCDKFSKAFQLYANEVFAKQSKIGTRAESMAVGVYYFIQDNGGGHAVNVIVLDTHKILWLEPQTGRMYILSDFEQATSWHQGF